jgi:hypothetical protein
MTDNRGASLISTPAYHPRVRTIPLRKKPKGYQDLESANAPRKPALVARTSRSAISNRPRPVTKVDERARYLLQSYGNKPRTKTIPVKFKKPDNYKETPSQNMPRKKILRARTDGRGNKRNKPGDKSNLGITKYSEGDVLRMFYKRVAQEAKLQGAMKGLKTMSNYYHDEVYAKAEDLLESGDFDACEQLLDRQIAKYAADIQKTKKPPPPFNQGDGDPNDSENDNEGNAAGEDELWNADDEETTPLPVKAKKGRTSPIYPDSDTMTGSGKDNAPGDETEVTHHTQQVGDAPFSDEDEEEDIGKRLVEAEEVALAKSIEMAVLDFDVDCITKLAARSDASGAHPLRDAAIAKTLADLEVDMKKLGSGNGPPRYPHGTDTDLQDHSNMTAEATRTGEAGQASRFVSNTPVVEVPKRHAFDDRIDAVQRRDGGSRFAAMSTARQEFPQDYSDYQSFTAGNSTSEQQGSRRDNEGLGKSLTFEAAVNSEIRKYNVSPTVAGHRVLQRYGNLPSERFAKAADVAADWREAAQEIVDREGVSRTDALRKCRFERPELFRQLQGR